MLADQDNFMLNEPLKVCIVAPLPPPYGGIANWSVMLREYARRQSDTVLDFVDVATRYRQVHDLSRWKRIGLGGLFMFWHTAVLLLALLRGAHVVHLTSAGQLVVYRDLLMLRLCSLFRRPVIYHIRFGRIPQIAPANTREWQLIRKACSRAHTVLTIDAATEEAIRGHASAPRIVRLPNPVDLASLPEPSIDPNRSTKRVLYIGWVLPAKGMEELVQAWAQLNPSGWELIIVGPGDPAYQASLLAKHTPSNVQFLGEKPHEEALKIMAQADIFVLPSHSEGFPNVILEAMALSKAIVATEVGAIPEMLADECGRTIAPRDVAALSQALASLMQDAELRERLGRKARQRAESAYALQAVFAQLQNLWVSVARHERSGAPVASAR